MIMTYKYVRWQAKPSWLQRSTSNRFEEEREQKKHTHTHTHMHMHAHATNKTNSINIRSLT